MATYSIIRNCNYETDSTVNKARLAVDAGLGNNDLTEALESLETTLSEHAEDDSEYGTKACAAAESEVEQAWNAISESWEESHYWTGRGWVAV